MAPRPSPTSSAWAAHHDTGWFQVSATGPPMATDTLPASTPSTACTSVEYGLV